MAINECQYKVYYDYENIISERKMLYIQKKRNTNII